MRTKQNIIQNTLWVILYEKTFCTPFNVFGAEGKSLEAKWIENYGQDPKSKGGPALCPRPTKDSEQWRYENMRVCIQATAQPVMQWDYYLKREYDFCLQYAIEEISQEMGRVTRISSSEKQRMGELVKKVARLWLEIEQQRYRVFLLMSDSGAEPMRSGLSALDRDGTLSLVIVPESRRRGNAQGERLDTDELVTDCKGRFRLFRAS